MDLVTGISFITDSQLNYLYIYSCTINLCILLPHNVISIIDKHAWLYVANTIIDIAIAIAIPGIQL